MKERKELEILACFVHGALAALHALGALYNARRRNHTDTAIHALVFVYDAHAAFKHYDRSNGHE